MQASSFGFCQTAFVLEGRINPQFHRPGNLKGVAGFKILTELYPYKCRSKSPISSTFSFSRLSNLNVKYMRFLKEYGVLVTTRRAPVYSIGWLSRWSSFCKKAIIPYHWEEWHTGFLCMWRLYVELTKNTSPDSQLFYKLEEKKHCKVTNLNWKGNSKVYTEDGL